MTRRVWNRDELLVAFNLYCKTPFGRLHHSNPDVIRIANLLGRTPNAVAMKLTNLASFDPALAARGVRGLRNASRRDREIFEEFYENPEALANLSEEAIDRLGVAGGEEFPSSDGTAPDGPTEVERTVRARRVQRFFRAAVLTNYESCCAISGIRIPALINASHIIPWSENVERRADPTNGIALCAIYDRAFDRGLITFDEDFAVVLSPVLLEPPRTDLHDTILVGIDNQRMRLPHRAQPDPDALEHHRRHIFQQNA